MSITEILKSLHATGLSSYYLARHLGTNQPKIQRTLKGKPCSYELGCKIVEMGKKFDIK